MEIQKVITLKGSADAISRVFPDKNKIPLWWPKDDGAKTAIKDLNFSFQGFDYIVSKELYHAFDIIIKSEGISLESKLTILPVGVDTVSLLWRTSLNSNYNPLKRIIDYKKAVSIKKNMDIILSDFQAFLSNDINIYGFHFERTTLKDTVLSATKMESTVYPDTKTIYKLINDLKTYIKDNGATETSFPMLNVTQVNNRYNIMIAIPVDKRIPDSKDFFYSQMIGIKDKTLTTEVKGGPAVLSEATKQTTNYMNDYDLSIPVKPFQSLITDRMKEADTSKWVTRFYYPII